MPDYDDLVDRLASIEEDLRDRAYDQLRQAAAASGDDELRAFKAEEKRLLQARRAIAKAIGALSAPGTSGSARSLSDDH